MADIKTLLAELGGDNPQNRAIAEGLRKQGINSTRDIGVRTVMETRYQPHIEDVSPGGYEEVPVKQFFNKTDNKEINPTRLGIYDVKDGGKTQGNIFFHLDADDKGNVNFRPQWSPRSRGFLRDNAVGRLIMTAGKIIPSPFQPGFVAADVADKLAHGKVMQAIASAVPYGIQEFAKSAELLQNLAGNSEFVATAKTAAGKIAEAAGVPSYAADLAGKVAASGVTAGLNGGDVGEAMLKAGAKSILGDSKDFLKSAGDFSKMGIGSLLPEGISADDIDSDALKQLDTTLQDTRGLENNLGDALDTRADENGIGGLYPNLIDVTAPLTLPPGAEPDETKLKEQYLLNPDEETATKELPKVPPIFPPKITPPKGPGEVPLPKNGLDDIVKGLVGGTIVGKVIDGFTENPTTPTTPTTSTTLADPLKGNYNFSWNKQQTKGPEKGIAYGQKYYGNHWTQQAPEAQVAKAEQPTEDITPSVQYGAEGGLMSLGGPMFKPTMTDSGISGGQISKDNVTSQVVQHMRKGGHVIDDKLHKEVNYLAGKGEPVHHIVSFMNHRKRMAEGGITSHSLGSYSDGGHLLKGPGDGMSDDIPATIADKQPARLANEEFVIPADVVSHLGNGSSESGAKVLYEMMAKIRKARTGNPKQGKQIDPHKLLPKV